MNCANHPDIERAAFCQNCGKPLCRECLRTVGSAIYCEPCLEAKLGASAANAAYPPAQGVYSFSQTPAGTSFNYAGAIPPPPPPGGPSPVLAGLLGFIPGVGAMYNGQFVKALVHLVVFGVLISLADKAPFFGILISGWVFYQVFDAYQTAKARRDGEPLPNPFGLNDLGDRIGMTHSAGPVATPGTASASSVPPAVPQGSPYTDTPPTAGYAAPYAPGYTAPGFAPVPGVPAPYNSPTYDNIPYTPPVVSGTGRSLPGAALVLIALGIFFLLGTMNILNTHWLGGIWPFLLIAIGIWIFARRLQGTIGLHPDGSATHRWYLIRCLHSPVWGLVLTGILALLDAWHVLSWDISWTFYLIGFGLLMMAERMASSQMQQEISAASQAAQPPAQYPPVDSTSPAATRDGECVSTTEGR